GIDLVRLGIDLRVGQAAAAAAVSQRPWCRTLAARDSTRSSGDEHDVRRGADGLRHLRRARVLCHGAAVSDAWQVDDHRDRRRQLGMLRARSSCQILTPLQSGMTFKTVFGGTALCLMTVGLSAGDDGQTQQSSEYLAHVKAAKDAARFDWVGLFARNCAAPDV